MTSRYGKNLPRLPRHAHNNCAWAIYGLRMRKRKARGAVRGRACACTYVRIRVPRRRAWKQSYTPCVPNRPFYAGSTLGGNFLLESKSYKEIRIHFRGRSYVHWDHSGGDYTIL